MKLEDFLIEEEGDDSRHLPDGRAASTWDGLGHVWNIGPGLTKGVTGSTIWTQEELKAAEEAEFSATRAAVAQLVKVPLGENRRTAVESLVYNIGVSGFAHSTVLREINAGNFAAVPAAFRLWNKAGGKVVKGLIKRREDEIRLWSHADDVPPPDGLKTSKNLPQATMETHMASSDVPAATVAVPVATLKAAANVSQTALKTSFGLGGLGSMLAMAGPLFATLFPSQSHLIMAVAATVIGAGVAATAFVNALHLNKATTDVTNGFIDSVTGIAKEIVTDLGGDPSAAADRQPA